jgi:anaerobic selenocysteine-containing dehydrogenase
MVLFYNNDEEDASMTDTHRKTTACPYDCPDACAMKGMFDGASVILEPNTDLPYTTFLCGKGLRWASRATSSERLTTPMLRTAGALVPVSWDEALDVWAEKIRSAVSRHGPLSLMHLSSAGSLYFSKLLLPHLFASLGGYTTKKGNLCSSRARNRSSSMRAGFSSGDGTRWRRTRTSSRCCSGCAAGGARSPR